MVAGASGLSNIYEDLTVARYTISGDLDLTFSNSGIVTPSISGDDSSATVLLQPDGKIVVAGRSESERDVFGDVSEYDIVVVRYTPTGTLDSIFKGTGIVTTSIGSGDDWGYGAALQPDGKIVVVGASENTVSDYDFAVLHYTIDGDLDPYFNNGAGFITTTVSNGADSAYGIAIQPDGKLVVVGQGDDHKYFVVTRYTITGALDSSFNQTGIATVSVNSIQEGDAVVLQPDGKIIAVGHSCDSLCENGNFVVLRYLSDGILDSAFNGTGIVTTSIGNHSGGISAAIQPDAKVLAIGISDGDFAVVRYLLNEYVYLPLVLKN